MRILLGHNVRNALLVAAVVIVAGWGCTTTAPVDPKTIPIQDVGGPEWLTQKGAAFSGERKVFYGVGLASDVSSSALKRRAAETQARRAIANTFNSYVAGMNKQYLADTTAGSMKAHSVEQHLEEVTKEITEKTLTGVTIEEYWEHPHKNEAYALARLDLARFLEAVRSMNSAQEEFEELDAKLRDAVRANAEEAFDELAKELDGKK